MKINKYILGAGALLCMMLPAASAQAQDCLLYTSDAADE